MHSLPSSYGSPSLTPAHPLPPSPPLPCPLSHRRYRKGGPVLSSRRRRPPVGWPAGVRPGTLLGGLGTATGVWGGSALQPAPPASLAGGGLISLRHSPVSCSLPAETLPTACSGRAHGPHGPEHFCGTGVAALPPGQRCRPPLLLPPRLRQPAAPGGRSRPGFVVSVSVSLSVSSGWCRRPTAVSTCPRRGPQQHAASGMGSCQPACQWRGQDGHPSRTEAGDRCCAHG